MKAAMQLLFAPTSPFVRKVMACAHLTGQAADIEMDVDKAMAVKLALLAQQAGGRGHQPLLHGEPFARQPGRRRGAGRVHDALLAERAGDEDEQRSRRELREAEQAERKLAAGEVEDLLAENRGEQRERGGSRIRVDFRGVRIEHGQRVAVGVVASQRPRAEHDVRLLVRTSGHGSVTRTPDDLLRELAASREFRDAEVDTGWLDRLTAAGAPAGSLRFAIANVPETTVALYSSST